MKVIKNLSVLGAPCLSRHLMDNKVLARQKLTSRFLNSMKSCTAHLEHLRWQPVTNWIHLGSLNRRHWIELSMECYLHFLCLFHSVHLSRLTDCRVLRLGLHVHCTVYFWCLSLKVCSIGRPFLASHVFHLPIEDFHDGLSLARVSGPRLLRTLHQTILLNEFGVSLLCKFFPLVRNFELLGDDSEVFRAI